MSNNIAVLVTAPDYAIHLISHDKFEKNTSKEGEAIDIKKRKSEMLLMFFVTTLYCSQF